MLCARSFYDTLSRYQSGDNQKAIEVYEYFVEHNPRSGTLINNMISVYHKLGREEMAAYHNWLVPTLQVKMTTCTLRLHTRVVEVTGVCTDVSACVLCSVTGAAATVFQLTDC